MSSIKINYSVPNFEDFLNSQNKFFNGRGDAIKKRMREYADDVFPLPFTHSCSEVGKFARKLLVPDFEVVIIFDKYDDHWDLLEGYPYFPRVA